MNFQLFFKNLLESFGGNLLTYAVFAFPLFFIFWIFGKQYFKKIRIQETERANTHHFKHDVGFSASSFLVFAIMDVWLIYLESKGYTQIYFDVKEYGYLWLIVSFCIVLFIDDMFFYWSHRAMHLPRFYKFFHKVHHESTDPSPLTSFAFHPSEAVIEQLTVVVLPFVLPLNFGVMIAWQIFSMANNVLAHLGYELYPKGWVKFPLLKYKVASIHHNMHHQLFNGNYALYFTWWDKWMGTEFKDYETRHEQIFERQHIKKSSDGLYSLTVSAIKHEANDAFTIRFGNVPDLFRNFSAGQHITIKAMLNGETLYRTFSLSCIPHSTDVASVTIKRIPNGRVTTWLYKNLQVGDTLQVTAPSGQFYLHPEPANQKHFVMIAGGSGITPIYSMIGTILQFEPKSKITLLYANKNADSIIFKDKIDHWAKEYQAQFVIRHFLSEKANIEGATKGYVTRVSLEEIINQHTRQSLEFYICGPEVMTNKLVDDLTYLGIEKSNIHRELFLLTTQLTPENSTKAKVSATVFGTAYTFETNGKQTILQSALAQNIPLPYSCQSGLCGMCRMKCTEGKVTMNNNQVLTEMDIKEGYILNCQAVPQTSTITIKHQ